MWILYEKEFANYESIREVVCVSVKLTLTTNKYKTTSCPWFIHNYIWMYVCICMYLHLSGRHYRMADPVPAVWMNTLIYSLGIRPFFVFDVNAVTSARLK
jgi:hypothetical protein